MQERGLCPLFSRVHEAFTVLVLSAFLTVIFEIVADVESLSSKAKFYNGV